MGQIPWYREPVLVRVTASQLTATLTGALVLLPWSGLVAGSALLGGLICLVATLYSGLRVFGARSDSPENALASFYRAELGKLLIAGALFTTVLLLLNDVNFIALCVAYVVVQIGGNVTASLCAPATNARQMS